jgi:Mg/Co/Ni transporter MgtE
MNKITIVTDSEGKLVGAVNGHTLASKDGKMEAKVSFSKGHKLHKVEVADDMERVTDAAAFHDRLVKHLPKG